MDTKRISELQIALKSRIDMIQEGSRKAIHVDGENVTVEQKDADTLRSLMGEAKSIQAAIQAEQYDEKAWEVSTSTGSHALDAEVKDMFAGDPLGGRDVGGAFINSDEFKSLMKQGGFTMQTPYEVAIPDLPSAGRKDVYNALPSGGPLEVFGRSQRDPMLQVQRRTERVRDLFNVARTNANLIDYFKVTGFVENGGRGSAASVADRTGDNTNFALKPKSNLAFTSAQAPVRTIAHWEAAHRNVLADEPQLQSVINNELMYGLALEEDRQILLGTGLNEELEGLLVTAGTQQYAQLAAETKADAIRRSLTLIVLANYEARGVVLNPLDWEDIELTKTTEGAYVIASNVSVGAESRLWRQNVVATAAMPEGKWLTGAFGLGATLYDRAQANIRIAEQHADFFVRNAIAILAEERLALAIKRPESFAEGTFYVPV